MSKGRLKWVLILLAVGGVIYVIMRQSNAAPTVGVLSTNDGRLVPSTVGNMFLKRAGVL